MKLAACQKYNPDNVPSEWRVEPIKHRIKLEYGYGLTEAARIEGNFPVFGSNGQVGTHDSYMVEGPGILIGRKGSVGQTHYSESCFWPIDTVYYICRLKDDDWLFLYYLLGFINLGLLNAATGVPGLTRRDAYDILGTFPDLGEQRRIATTLKLTDDAIAKAKTELEAARGFKRSLMENLFVSGMPGRHTEFVETKIGLVPKGWQVKQLGMLLVSSQYGLSEGMTESGKFPILRMSNIDNGIVNTDDVKYINLDDAVFETYQLRTGDILFNRTNSMEYVGRVGIVNEDMNAVFASYLVRLTADTTQIDPWFLNFCLNSKRVKDRYRRYATPAVQQANINPRNLKKTLIALPSLTESNEQHEIVELLRSVDHSIISIAKKVDALEEVKKSLLQNLLTGKIRIPESAIHA